MATLIDPAVVADHEPTRAELVAEVAAKKAKHDRLPVHFEAKRLRLMRDIFDLIDQINALPQP
jgi:hypothetical protein